MKRVDGRNLRGSRLGYTPAPRTAAMAGESWIFYAGFGLLVGAFIVGKRLREGSEK